MGKESRERAVRFMEARRSGDVPELLQWLADLEYRDMAVTTLGKQRDPRATKPLLRLLQAGDPALRRSAAKALGEIGDPRAVPGLLRSATDEVDVAARTWAIHSLGQIGAPECVETLLGLLDASDREVRWAASAALSDMGVEEARESIKREMRRDFWPFRWGYRKARRMATGARMTGPRAPGRVSAWVYCTFRRILRPVLATGVPRIAGGLLIASWILRSVSHDDLGRLLLAAAVVSAVDLVSGTVWLSLTPLRTERPRPDISEHLTLLPAGVFVGRLFSVAIAPGISVTGIWPICVVALILAIVDAAATNITNRVRWLSRRNRWRRKDPPS